MDGIKAITFDIFGTVVDWRSSIIREGKRLRDTLPGIDWGSFADAWRGGYEPAMGKVNSGELPWTNIDGLHMQILRQLLDDFDIHNLSESDVEYLNKVWHRLDPWPDVIGGLERLRAGYVVAALSNGNMALLTNMAKRASLPWDVILSAELVRHYKPDPQVYEIAADLLGLSPGEILMTAAHPHDLEGARAVGFRTAFIRRPHEYGPVENPDLAGAGGFDLEAGDVGELATQLGV